MSDSIATHPCRACGAPLAPEAQYCSQCGKPIDPTSALGPSSKPKWYHNIWVVLLMLFVVLGPFGLPLLWKSPRFPKWAKLALTCLTLLYTWWLVMLTLAAARSAITHFNDLQSTF